MRASACKLWSLLEGGRAQGAIGGDIPVDLLADQVSAIGDGWVITFPVESEPFGRGRIHGLGQWVCNVETKGAMKRNRLIRSLANATSIVLLELIAIFGCRRTVVSGTFSKIARREKSWYAG